MKIEDYLSKAYAADIKGQKAPVIAELKTALAGDSSLMEAAEMKLADLNEMIAARGTGACAFSTKYQEYLSEALAS